MFLSVIVILYIQLLFLALLSIFIHVTISLKSLCLCTFAPIFQTSVLGGIHKEGLGFSTSRAVDFGMADDL